MYKYNTSKESFILPSIEVSKADFNDSLLEHLEPYEREWILSFIRKIASKNPNWNFDPFYNNLATLSFRKSNHFNIGGTGSYDLKKNIISYSDETCIFHELLHTATSMIAAKRYFGGFEQITKGIFHKSIGVGLTEGYTNLLEGRYDTVHGWYCMEMDIAKNLNRSVSDMETYYNNMDLFHLVAYLERFTSRRDIIDFLEMLDYINRNQYKESDRLRKEIMDLYYECQVYTFRCMIMKLLDDIANNLITYEQAQEKLVFMINFSLSKAIIGKKRCDIEPIEKLRGQIPDLIHISENDIKTYRLTL